MLTEYVSEERISSPEEGDKGVGSSVAFMLKLNWPAGALTVAEPFRSSAALKTPAVNEGVKITPNCVANEAGVVSMAQVT